MTDNRLAASFDCMVQDLDNVRITSVTTGYTDDQSRTMGIRLQEDNKRVLHNYSMKKIDDLKKTPEFSSLDGKQVPHTTWSTGSIEMLLKHSITKNKYYKKIKDLDFEIKRFGTISNENKDMVKSRIGLQYWTNFNRD